MKEESPSLADVKAYLRYAFGIYEIEVLSEDQNLLHLERNYTVEIENPHLFKLISAGEVVAPFDEVEELCIFIKQN